jgi:hypothetical protein
MTRAQICDRAVFLSSVCHGENADQALNEWLDVDAAQRQEIGRLRQALKAVRPALREASNDYNHPRFTDRHGTGFRIDVALKVIEAALAATGEEHD